MKAIPYKQDGNIHHKCSPQEATHLKINIPNPDTMLMLPVMIKGTRQGTNKWTWNGDVVKPTLKPSVAINGFEDITDEEAQRILNGEKIEPRRKVCHMWINDGKAQFLNDCTDSSIRNKTIDLLEVEEWEP